MKLISSYVKVDTSVRSLLILRLPPGVMDPRVKMNKHASQRALFLVGILLLSVVPLMAPTAMADGARDASISIQTSPSNGLEVNPGESGEYTVRIYNTGSNPVTVSLSTSEEATQECGAYSSTISPPTLAVESGDYGEASMNVTLTQTAEGTCDTTITANANEAATPPDVGGQPAQETKTVTTTAGDGSGSALFGVDLYMESESQRSQTWGGESVMEFDVVVENTGQTNETVALSVEDTTGSSCQNADDLDVSLSDDSVNLDQNETQTVTVSVEVPDGQEANKYCWEITGTVTSDPSQEAKDIEEFDLTVPELHECTMALSRTSLTVDPDEEGTLSVTLTNDGNSDWSVSMSKSGSRSGWVTYDGASSGLLPYDNGEGTKSFDILVSPDDSVTAGQESLIQIQAKDGNTVKCSQELRVIVGQSFGASLSLSSSSLSDIEPGTNGTVTLTVTNQGNGADNLRISSSSPPSGWNVQLESTTVSVGSKHGSEKSSNVEVVVNVPLSALATESIDIAFSVLPAGGGAAYAEVTLSVSVMAVHGIEAEANALEQTGRSSSLVKFPVSIQNTGNIEDNYRCVEMSQTASPKWAVHCEDSIGNIISPSQGIPIAPQTIVDIFVVVTVDGEEELSSTRVTVRIINKDDSTNSGDEDNDGIPDNQREFVFLAILSDRIFAMDAQLVDGGLDQRSGTAVLPPSGAQTHGFWVTNTGDGNDKVIFDVTGLQGLATRQITLYGLPVDGPVDIPVGFGIWDQNQSMFLVDTFGNPIIGSTKDAAETQMCGLDLCSGGYDARPFKLYFEISIEVNPGANTGDGGVLNVVALSTKNAANRSGSFDITLDVQIIYQFEFDSSVDDREISVVYPSKEEFSVNLTNTGNIRAEVLVFTSESFRGWNVLIDSTSNYCGLEGSDYVCWVDVDESIELLITVRAPNGAEIADTFKFTLSSEPVETGVVDRENIEFTVKGTPDSGYFGLGLDSQQLTNGIYAIVLLGVLVIAFRTFSRRS